MRHRRGIVRYYTVPLATNGMGEGFDQYYEVETPRGVTVSLTPEEEREVIKEVIRQRILHRMNRAQRVEEAAISSVGTALGLAVGGLIAGWLLGRASSRR